MSDTVEKPNWWNDLGSFFSFSTPSSSSIDIDYLLEDLEDHLHGSTDGLASSSFRSTQSHVIHKTGSQANRTNTLISGSNDDNLILGYGGFDYLSGGRGDDILHGGAERDFFNPGEGIDLVIGSDNYSNTSEKDLVSYHTATSGIVVEFLGSNPFTYVSDDGHGDYDILYAVPNIFGSDHGDVIYGRSNANNILWGGLGDDVLYGVGDNNVLIGGQGADIIHGGSGVDTILIGEGGDEAEGGGGRDIFKFLASFLPDLASNAARITDFATGSSGDKLDVSHLLKAIGYSGSNPVSDGYIKIESSGSDTLVKFDADGSGGASAKTIATLEDVSAGSFSTSSNLVTNSPAFLYVPVLGQSNARALRVFDGDDDSGLSLIQDILEDETDYDGVEIIPTENSGNTVDLAVGGSIVVGKDGSNLDSTWWFADSWKPGELLIRAVDMMAVQIAELRAQGIADITLVWGQGESDADVLGAPNSDSGKNTAQQKYIDSTLAIFDYIKDQLGDDITFYIMQTGRYNAEAALLDGENPSHVEDVVDGLPLIHEAQEKMALEREDIFLAASYKDLPMRSEVNASEAEDSWHYESEEMEIIGSRIGDFIALNLGYTNIINEPGSYPAHLLADVNLQSDSGKSVNGNNKENIIVGTTGNDTLDGKGGNDLLFGGSGNDTIKGGSGNDTAVFRGRSEDYTIQNHGGGSYTITDNEGNEGTDSLTSIETLRFANLEVSGSSESTSPPSSPPSSPPPPPPSSGGIDSGTDGNDVMSGSEGNDTIKGRAGNDTIYGYGGDDTLWGNEGDDIFIGGAGADWIKGSDGRDIYVYLDILDAGDTIVDFRAGSGEKIDVSAILLGAPNFVADDAFDDGFLRLQQSGSHAQVYIDPDGSAGGLGEVMLVTLENTNIGEIGSSSFIFSPDTIDTLGDSPDTPDDPPDVPDTPPPPPPPPSDDGVFSGNDSISGTSGDDTLYGYAGDDTLKGREGHDILHGGDGSDTLWGNDGNDFLYGGSGADWMKGSDGADIFVFGEGAFDAIDTIADFRPHSGDAIELIDILEGYDPLADAISDFVRITTNGSNSVVSVDSDGSVGGESFTQIAVILGITGLENESQLLADGALIIQ